jgi:hypothetical protein
MHRRPSSDEVVGSRLYTPSGNMLDDIEVDSVGLNGGVHGAGPD